MLSLPAGILRCDLSDIIHRCRGRSSEQWCASEQVRSTEPEEFEARVNFEDFFNEVSTFTNEPLSIKRFAGGTFPPGGTSAKKAKRANCRCRLVEQRAFQNVFSTKRLRLSYARQTQLS
jgi:hypothetical protein